MSEREIGVREVPQDDANKQTNGPQQFAIKKSGQLRRRRRRRMTFLRKISQKSKLSHLCI